MGNEDLRNQKLDGFDLDGPAQLDAGIFGLPFGFEESELVLLPVPWEVTASYGSGSSVAPAAILEASRQVDLFDPQFDEAWKDGIFMTEISDRWKEKNRMLKPRATEAIQLMERGASPGNNHGVKGTLELINQYHAELNSWVLEQCESFLERGKLIGVLGGEHSTPLGLLQALARKHPEFGILQIDAHADLREAYEGFEFSHASIMHNALKVEQVKKLVQVGIRDLGSAEKERIDQDGRISTFFQTDIDQRKFGSGNWDEICSEVISQLPGQVYISFDIDGLDPSLCPNTGTPVPGGLQFAEATFLLKRLVDSGRKIIGFDLCEVAPGKNSDWDADVGARVLFKLCSSALKTRKV